MMATTRPTTKSTDGGQAKPCWGYLVEFDTPEALLSAAERVRDAGFRRWDAHAPFPVHGLNDAMGLKPTRLPWLVFAAGVTGAVTGLVLQAYTNAFDYPMLISGKPLFSLPANIPVMFELTILFAAIAAFVGMLLMNDLPRPYHPLFRCAAFRRATADRFFISIEAADPRFEGDRTRAFLESLGGSAVQVVEAGPPTAAAGVGEQPTADDANV